MTELFIKVPYYVYKITNKSTGQYYIGSRYSHLKYNRSPENDLWKKYYTSSNAVQLLIATYGKDDFVAEVIYTSNDKDDTFWSEQALIAESIADCRCINKQYVDQRTARRVWTTAGLKYWHNGQGQFVTATKSPGPGWLKGNWRTGRKKWSNGTQIKFSHTCPGPEWNSWTKSSAQTHWKVEPNVVQSWYDSGLSLKKIEQLHGISSNYLQHMVRKGVLKTRTKKEAIAIDPSIVRHSHSEKFKQEQSLRLLQRYADGWQPSSWNKTT